MSIQGSKKKEAKKRKQKKIDLKCSNHIEHAFIYLLIYQFCVE